jgi:hypothetical protein
LGHSLTMIDKLIAGDEDKSSPHVIHTLIHLPKT